MNLLTPTRVQHKPTEYTAIRVTWDNWADVCAFVPVPQNGHGLEFTLPELRMMVNTAVGNPEVVREGDYLLKDRDGTLTVWDPDEFSANFTQAPCQHLDSYWHMGTTDRHPICAQCGRNRNGE